MSKIRILLVGQQALLWAGLRLLIVEQPELEVVGEAPEGPAALAHVRDMTPDVVLLSLGLPTSRGLTLIKQLRYQCPHTQVVVISTSADVASMRSAMAAGSTAYLTTQAAPADLLTAIHTVAQGQPFMDPILMGSLLSDLLGQWAPRQAAATHKPKCLLSPREREVLIRLAQGYTHRQIAAQMYVSVHSIETYRARIAQKLELHSRAELVRYAHTSGLFTQQMFR
jgi:two-component system response regulator NreC